MTEKNVDYRNGTVTVVGDTYCLCLRARYVTTLVGKDEGLNVGAHMTEEEARALLAGLQEALA